MNPESTRATITPTVAIIVTCLALTPITATIYYQLAPMCGPHPEGIYGAGFDLHGQNLSYTSFNNPAGWIGADLQGADLAGADIRYVDLVGANLQGANLTGANLQFANLSCGDLQGANLTGANLEYTSLAGATINAGLSQSNTTTFNGANMDHAVLTGANCGTSPNNHITAAGANKGNVVNPGGALGYCSPPL